MLNSLVTGAVLAAIAAVALSAADPSYTGRWKMNPAKSDLGETTVTFSQTPSGQMQAIADGDSYNFQFDGKDYPARGVTAAWKSVAPNEWQTTWKLNGTQISVDLVRVSSDGKVLNIHSNGIKAGGGTYENTTEYQRVLGNSGLLGKWKTKNVQSTSPELMELTLSGNDGISFRFPDVNLSCDAKVDGKEVPCTGKGNMFVKGLTIAVTEPNRGIIETVVKRNGQMIYKDSYAVSPDGKTLTETGATAAHEKFRIVYDRL